MLATQDSPRLSAQRCPRARVYGRSIIGTANASRAGNGGARETAHDPTLTSHRTAERLMRDEVERVSIAEIKSLLTTSALRLYSTNPGPIVSAFIT
jgi:hypothetical protein